MRKIAFLIHYVVFGEKSIGSARFSSIQRSNAVNVNRMSFSSSTMWPAVSQVHLRRSEWIVNEKQCKREKEREAHVVHVMWLNANIWFAIWTNWKENENLENWHDNLRSDRKSRTVSTTKTSTSTRARKNGIRFGPNIYFIFSSTFIASFDVTNWKLSDFLSYFRHGIYSRGSFEPKRK